MEVKGYFVILTFVYKFSVLSISTTKSSIIQAQQHLNTMILLPTDIYTIEENVLDTNAGKQLS
jgi:hypothetical protein